MFWAEGSIPEYPEVRENIRAEDSWEEGLKHQLQRRQRERTGGS